MAKVQYAVAGKIMDQQRDTGAAMVNLINAANLGVNRAGDAMAAAATGALMPSVTGRTRSFGLPGAAGIPQASQHKEAAAAFVTWMVQPENQVESYTALGNLPTRTTVLQTLDKDGKLASGKVLLEQAAVVEPLFKQGTPGWYPQFSSAAATALNQAAKGQVTVADAVKQIADGAAEAMK